MRQPPPAAARPVEGTSAPEEVRAEDDEILRQLRSTQALETTTSPEGLIHMMTAGRATCIVFSDDNLPLEGSDHTRPLYISVGFSGRRVPSVLLDNGSALNVCPLATAIALGYAPSNFSPSTQTVRAYDSTRREVMGTLEIKLLIGPATFVAVFQKVKFIHDGQVVVVQSVGDMFIAAEPVLEISHTDEDIFLTGFIFDEVQTVEIEDFCRDFVTMSFDQHGSTVVLDIMRSMSYLPGMGLGRRQHGPSEFITIPHHDVPFGLGSSPQRLTIDTWRVCARRDHMHHLMGSSEDSAPPRKPSFSASSSSYNRTSLMTLCFPDEIDDHGTFAEIGDVVDGVVPRDEYVDEMLAMSLSQTEEMAPPELASPFDLFGVSVLEIAEEIQVAPTPEVVEDVIVAVDLFDGPVGLVEGASDLVDPPLTFDVLSGLVSRHDYVSDFSSMDFSTFKYLSVSHVIDLSAPSSPTSQIFDIDDEIAQYDSDDDSFSVSDSDPVDQRVSPAVGDTEIVHFGTADQPRELRIGSDLSTDERDSLIQLLISYLDVFAWSYEDMPGLDPSIVKEEIQKQLSVGFLSVVEYPEWLANVVPVPKKDGKNAGATYQRAATTLFHDMMHRDVEVYVDDMIVKSRDRSDHLAALKSERSIEVDPDKIRAILDMPAPRTEREVRGFLGRLQYISRFIGRLTDICEPIFRLLRKSQPTVWDDQCQRAFERIREYLLSPPVLAPPTPGPSLLLYLSVSDVALGCMLAQLDDSGKDRAIYYLSKKMLDYETRYVMIERYCLALVWATRRLRHYMTEWLVLLTEFEIHYVTQKSIRGSIVADHLASLPVSDARAIDDDFPDEDVAAYMFGWHSRIDILPTNNIVEYEACILGLETALELGIRQMEVFGDSNLVLRQIQGEWKTRDVKLRPYHAYLELLVGRFDDLRYTHLPRAQNQFADALATLASMIDIPVDTTVRPLLIESRSAPAYCCLIDDVEPDDGLPWYHDIYHFLRLGVYPEAATAKDRRALR
ncbi:Retrovirus-related Pol polyprotein from transposon 17.6 [Vitis vinifera]|uniref:Retrovirus-related Pol polyprotein from transposon 17.6 n=1 Tax=Vitis vinifera TaxID=29760 RepID=A0A438G7V2_VITVI|nr:Retrovirus-related Pol polyprotein from transposon 17.6 [Vitis vinifera]